MQQVKDFTVMFRLINLGIYNYKNVIIYIYIYTFTIGLKYFRFYFASSKDM